MFEKEGYGLRLNMRFELARESDGKNRPALLTSARTKLFSFRSAYPLMIGETVVATVQPDFHHVCIFKAKVLTCEHHEHDSEELNYYHVFARLVSGRDQYADFLLYAKRTSHAMHEDIRIFAPWPVFFTKGETAFRAQCLNVSYGGLFIATNEAELFGIGEEIQLAVTTPDKEDPVHLKGEVVYVVEKDYAMQMGLEVGLGVKLIFEDENEEWRWEDSLSLLHKKVLNEKMKETP